MADIETAKEQGDFGFPFRRDGWPIGEYVIGVKRGAPAPTPAEGFEFVPWYPTPDDRLAVDYRKA